MNFKIFAAALAIGLAGPAIALAQAAPFQDEVDALARARAAYRAAVASHDKAAITKAHADLASASSNLTHDRQIAAATAAAPASGPEREPYLALTKARDEYHDAVTSHDAAAIARTKAALRTASHNLTVVRRARH